MWVRGRGDNNSDVAAAAAAADDAARQHKINAPLLLLPLLITMGTLIQLQPNAVSLVTRIKSY